MAWRTKVRQYYTTETKPRKNSAPKPAVKFYDVKNDSWLDEPQEVYDSVQELDAEKSSPINLASKYLTTFLAHTKDDSGINHDMSLHANKPKVAPVPASVQDDNDFSMEF